MSLTKKQNMHHYEVLWRNIRIAPHKTMHCSVIKSLQRAALYKIWRQNSLFGHWTRGYHRPTGAEMAPAASYAVSDESASEFEVESTPISVNKTSTKKRAATPMLKWRLLQQYPWTLSRAFPYLSFHLRVIRMYVLSLHLFRLLTSFFRFCPFRERPSIIRQSLWIVS